MCVVRRDIINFQESERGRGREKITICGRVDLRRNKNKMKKKLKINNNNKKYLEALIINL